MEWFFSLDLQFKCPSKYVPETHPVGECFTGSKWYLFLFSLGEILKTKKQRNKEKTFPLIKGGSHERHAGQSWLLHNVVPSEVLQTSAPRLLTRSQGSPWRQLFLARPSTSRPRRMSPPRRNKHGLINKVMANWTSSSDAGEASAGCGTPRRMFVLLPD